MAVTYNLKGTTNSSFKVGKQGAGTLEIGAIDASGNTGSVASITGHLVPSANISYDLGTSSLMWRDLYVGPGSIYVNGKKVIEDNSGTITVSTDADQNLNIATSGTGQTTIQSVAGLNLTTTSTGDITFTTASGQVNFDGDVIVNAAKSISSSNSDPITFADPISVSGNSTMANLTISGNLTVQGTTTTIDSTTVQIQNAFKFEGTTADDFETTLTVTDPTADRTITLPDATGTVVLADATQTLTNKTISLTNNTLTGTTAEFNTALSDGSFATLAGTETLTNKTLTAPIISSISNTGTLTLPTSTDTLVGRDTTDTLTNKTLGATTISGHLTPSANVTYDLGTSSLRFRDIYLSGSTIDLGGAKLTNDGSDNLDIKDSSGNRKIIRASAIELVDSNGKKMKLERDATSGKLKQTRKNADDTDEGSTDTLDIVGDTSPQLGGDLDTNGNNITFGDNDIAYFGTGNDLSIYHDGSHSYIKDAGTGNLWIGSNGEYTALGNSTASEFYIKASNNGAVELYYDNSKKLETTTSGVSVTGDGAFSGNVTVTGNLTVNGTTTTVNSTEVNVQNAFVFEGTTADDYETTLTVTDPTADRTITLPDATGTVVLADATQTLSNKTIDSASNTLTLDLSEGTLTGTTAEFNTALSDGSFATLAGTETLTNKTISLTNNTLSGTISEFNSALSDGSFVTQTGNETISNKTIESPIVTGNVAFDTDVLFVDATNNRVGVNTSSPADPFVVKQGTGETRFGGTNGRTLSAYDNGTLNNFDFKANQVYFEADLLVNGAKKISTHNGSTQNLYITTNDATKAIYTDRDIITDGDLIFEGATADAYETTLTATDPTADRTITLPDSTGTVLLDSSTFGYPKDFGSITGSTSTFPIGTNSDFGALTGDTVVGLGLADLGTIGLDVSGTVTATAFSGDGSALTSISASSFTTAASAPVSPSEGDAYYNTTDNSVYVYDGTLWGKITPNYFTATGGTTYTFGQYTVHAFTSSGTFSVTGSKSIDYLVVAGGGAGGGETSGASAGGGGGGGGLVYVSNSTITTGDYTVTIGAGGTGGTGNGGQGGNSSFNSTTAYGGGGGAIGNGSANAPTYENYGGGGGGADDGFGAAATAQGNAGGDGSQSGSVGSAGGTGNGKAGGGGGGGDGNTNAGNPGGAGGDGVDYSSTFGTDYGENGVFSGGGAGGNGDPATATVSGGLGGGGDAGAGNGQDGTANTGGGGGADQGGAATSNGGNGGSGIVLIRYLT